MKLKTVKRVVIGAAIGYAFAIRRLEPEPHDLLDPEWHREAPTRLALLGLARLMPWLYARWGEQGVKALQFVFYQVGVDRAPLLLEGLRIDPDDARSLGRVLDYEDGLVGVKGVWTEECRGRAVKEERYCPGARELAACPEVCTCLMMAMEAGTFSIINPELNAPEITKLLSRGDDCCLAIIELPGGGKSASKQSPQATPGQFPPVIEVPGLRAKLMVTGLASLAKAIVKLATSGPDQPMKWYEFIRYEP
ncbi:MAG: hypothetical protein ACYC99_15185 [Candidatus Geothermincolia bacterium]